MDKHQRLRRRIECAIEKWQKRGEIIDFSAEELVQKIESSSICYLTGAAINLDDFNSWQIDHIVPYSRGGKSTLDNLGLTTKEANQAKHNLTVDEFIALCKEVLEYSKTPRAGNDPDTILPAFNGQV